MAVTIGGPDKCEGQDSSKGDVFIMIDIMDWRWR